MKLLLTAWLEYFTDEKEDVSIFWRISGNVEGDAPGSLKCGILGPNTSLSNNIGNHHVALRSHRGRRRNKGIAFAFHCSSIVVGIMTILSISLSTYYVKVHIP